MLSVPDFKFPRKISIKVLKAEDLVFSKKDNKKRNNSKFRVVVLGGKKKEASMLIDNISGNPEWNFSCIIKLHRNKNDPICLLVEDSEGHHKGQVVIPLVKISPKPFNSNQDLTTPKNITRSELEPTNKISNATGYLIYSVWVEEYCTQDDGESKHSFKHSMSNIFGSMNVISSSKSRSSAATGSVTDISSEISLNKPQTHKKTLNFLHIKSKKDKSKKLSSNIKLSPDSSDADEIMEYGNPFGVDMNKNQPNQSKNGLSSTLEAPLIHTSSNSFNITNAVDPVKTYNPSFSSISEIKEDNTINQSKLNRMTPIILPPSKPKSVILNQEIESKELSDTIPPIRNKQISSINTLDFPENKNLFSTNNSEATFEDANIQYKPGHKVVNESDYSLFNEYNIYQPPSTTFKTDSKEAINTTLTITPPKTNANIAPISNPNFNSEPSTLLSKVKSRNDENMNLKQEISKPIEPMSLSKEYQPALIPSIPIALPSVNASQTTSDYLVATKNNDTTFPSMNTTSKSDNLRNTNLKEECKSQNVIPIVKENQPCYKPATLPLINVHQIPTKQCTTKEDISKVIQPVLVNKRNSENIQNESLKQKVNSKPIQDLSSFKECESRNETVNPYLKSTKTGSEVTAKEFTKEISSLNHYTATQPNIQGSLVNQDSKLTEYRSDEVDRGYKHSRKSNSGGDISKVPDRKEKDVNTATIKIKIEEAEFLRKENSELKTQNAYYSHMVFELNKELESVKDILFKLRSRLLVEGAIEFLEMV